MRVLDLDSQYWSGQIQNIESLKRLYSVRWGGNKWPRRPLGVNYSVEACSHCVKVGLVVLLLKRELDSLTESLRWWWSGWPPLLVTMWVIPEDLGNFSPKKLLSLFLFWSKSQFSKIINLQFYGLEIAVDTRIKCKCFSNFWQQYCHRWLHCSAILLQKIASVNQLNCFLRYWCFGKISLSTWVPIFF